jgi:hypothetical protein
MSQNELCRIEVRPKIPGKHAPEHADPYILADLEMQMGGVSSVRGPDGANALPPFDSLAFADPDPVKMTVEAVDVPRVAALQVSVADNHHVPPARSEVSGVNNDPIGDDINRVVQIGVPASDPVPILSKMAIWPESPRLVVPLSTFDAHRQAKTIRQPH